MRKSVIAPTTAEKLGIKTQETSTPVPIVIDGRPVTEYFGKNKIRESEIELLLAGYDKKAQDILLMTIDSNGRVSIIEKREKE